MLKLILIVVLFAHGIGHVLFLAPAVRLADWAGQTSHSWVLTGLIGDGLTRAVAAAVWLSAIALYLAAVGGLAAGQEWWRFAAIAGAVVSLAGIIAFWDGIATSNAFFALVVNALVLAALILARWPAASEVGA